MSLPFLNKGRISQVIKNKQQDSGAIVSDVVESESEEMSIAGEIIAAIKADDKAALWAAMEAAFQMMEMAPHEEGPHE